jgi:hypothetical protein
MIASAPQFIIHLPIQPAMQANRSKFYEYVDVFIAWGYVNEFYMEIMSIHLRALFLKLCSSAKLSFMLGGEATLKIVWQFFIPFIPAYHTTYVT